MGFDIKKVAKGGVDKVKNVGKDVGKVGSDAVKEIKDKLRSAEKDFESLEKKVKEAERALEKAKDRANDAERRVGASGASPDLARLERTREEAERALREAEVSVARANDAFNRIPADIEARVGGLTRELAAAQGALAQAQAAAAGLQQRFAPALAAARFAAQDPGRLIVVRGASLDAPLAALRTGRVALDVDVAIMGEPRRLRVSTDVRDLPATARALAQAVLPS